MSRYILAAVIACGALVSLASPAGAAQSAGLGFAPQPHPMAVLHVDHRCGPGRHFVRGYRRHGRMVRAYCAPVRRHRH